MQHSTLLTRLTAVLVTVLGVLTFGNSATHGQTIALVGATIETVGEAGRIETGNVVIRDGKIEAVGADVEIPETAQLIDAAGKVVMPGVIDPYLRRDRTLVAPEREET